MILTRKRWTSCHADEQHMHCKNVSRSTQTVSGLNQCSESVSGWLDVQGSRQGKKFLILWKIFLIDTRSHIQKNRDTALLTSLHLSTFLSICDGQQIKERGHNQVKKRCKKTSKNCTWKQTMNQIRKHLKKKRIALLKLEDCHLIKVCLV